MSDNEWASPSADNEWGAPSTNSDNEWASGTHSSEANEWDIPRDASDNEWGTPSTGTHGATTSDQAWGAPDDEFEEEGDDEQEGVGSRLPVPVPLAAGLAALVLAGVGYTTYSSLGSDTPTPPPTASSSATSPTPSSTSSTSSTSPTSLPTSSTSTSSSSSTTTREELTPAESEALAKSFTDKYVAAFNKQDPERVRKLLSEKSRKEISRTRLAKRFEKVTPGSKYWADEFTFTPDGPDRGVLRVILRSKISGTTYRRPVQMTLVRENGGWYWQPSDQELKKYY